MICILWCFPTFQATSLDDVFTSWARRYMIHRSVRVHTLDNWDGPKWRSLKPWKGHSWVQTMPLWRTWGLMFQKLEIFSNEMFQFHRVETWVVKVNNCSNCGGARRLTRAVCRDLRVYFLLGKVVEPMWAMKKGPWLFRALVGDEILPSLCGDYFINH